MNRLVTVLFTNPLLEKKLQDDTHENLRRLRNAFPQLATIPRATLEAAMKEKHGILFLHIDNFSQNAVRFKSIFDGMVFLATCPVTITPQAGIRC